MDKKAKKNLLPSVSEPTPKKSTTTKQKSSLGKRKESELGDCSDELDFVVMNEARKKIQKIAHSNTIERESAAKIKSEPMLELSFVQTIMACVCGDDHTITLSDDGTVHSFGANNKGSLGLGHNDDVSLPTPIPNLPQINV